MLIDDKNKIIDLEKVNGSLIVFQGHFLIFLTGAPFFKTDFSLSNALPTMQRTTWDNHHGSEF